MPMPGWRVIFRSMAGLVLTRLRRERRWLQPCGRERLLYLDAAKSFWRDWVVSYDSGQQQILGQEAVAGGRQWIRQSQQWYRGHYQTMVGESSQACGIRRSGPEAMGHFRCDGNSLSDVVGERQPASPVLGARRLVVHPADAPRLAAALWYERMTISVGKRGWRKSEAQTPREFLGSIEDPPLQKKVAVFTEHYEGARFGESKAERRAVAGVV